MKNPVTKITKYLTRKYPVRLHMSLILLTVTLSGMLFAKIFYLMGFTSMGMRYAMSVLLAYGILLILVRIWLWYISPSRRTPDLSSIDGPSLDGGSGGTGGSSSEGIAAFKGGGGGSYGGGGASASFGETKGAVIPSNINSGISPSINAGSANSPSAGASFSNASSGSGKFSIGNLDIGDAGEAILVILLLLVVLAVTGAWVYLIIEAPAILGEAAFEFGLGGSLFRKIRRIHSGNWAGSIIKSTVIPSAIILLLAGSFGFASDAFCPGRYKLIPVIEECILENAE